MIIDLKIGNEWQYFDKDGELFPWYVKPVLDILDGMDLTDKVVWEYGLGASSCWYAKRAREIHGVDSNEEWVKNVSDTLRFNNRQANTTLYLEHDLDKYVNAIKNKGVEYDIIITDGIFRNETTLMALNYAKKGCMLIMDNYLQESVEIASQEVQDAVNKYPHEIYSQDGHPDWKSLILYK